MPFVRTRGERVVKPYSDPIALPFTLTSRERAFAEALFDAKTDEELQVAYREHLGPIYSHEMVTGYVEIGDLVGEAAVEAVIFDKPHDVFTTPMVTPEYGQVRKAVDMEYLFDLAHEDGITYSMDRVGHLIVNSTRFTRRPIREDIAWMLGGEPTTRRIGMERPPNVRDLAEPPGSSPETSGMFYESVRAIPLPTRVRLGIEAEVRRMRAEFDRRFDGRGGFFVAGPGASASEAEAAARLYRDRAEALYHDAYTHRSRLIARTEVQFAQNFGRYNGWQQAIDDGLIDVEKAGKQWKIGPELSRRGKRVCPTCRPLKDVVVRINEPFDTLHGPVMMPPMHPACRCTAVLIPDIDKAGFGDSVGPYRSPEARGYDLSDVPEPTPLTDLGANPYAQALQTEWADFAHMAVNADYEARVVSLMEQGALGADDNAMRAQVKIQVNQELMRRIDLLAQDDPELKRQITEWLVQPGSTTDPEKLYRANLGQLTREYVDTWAQSSSGLRAKRSLNLQREAEKLFGFRSESFEEFGPIKYIDSPPPIKAVAAEVRPPEIIEWMETYRNHGAQWADVRDHEGLFARAFLRAQYDMTQEMLTRAGVPPGGKVWLYRGMESDVIDLPVGRAVPVSAVNPLSSWAWHPRVALDFSGTSMSSRVFVAAVPRERIVGGAISGVGCFGEAEVIVAFPEGSVVRSVIPRNYLQGLGLLDKNGELTSEWIYPRNLFSVPALESMFRPSWEPSGVFNE